MVQLHRAIDNDFLEKLGNEFLADPQLSFETNTGTYRQEIKHTRSPFKLELFLLSSDPHDQARFQRRVEVALFERRLWLPTAEDVVVWKLRWPRSKDRDDVRGVIGVQGDRLDWSYIEGWCDRHGTRALLEEIRRTVPRI